MSTILPFLLLLASFCITLTIVKYARIPIRPRDRILLICLRTGAIAVIVLALMEPVFHFTSFITPDTSIPVLVDNSLSMQLFQNSKTVRRALHNLAAIEGEKAGEADTEHGHKKGDSRHFIFYAFGDSLRRIDSPGNLSFTDTRSFFPALNGTISGGMGTGQEKALRNAKDFLVISDGNWSNSSVPDRYLTEKNVYYIPFPPALRPASLNLSLASSSLSFNADSSGSIEIRYDGVFMKAGSLLLKLHEKGRIVLERSAPVDSGPNTAAMKIQFPRLPPGRHLYRVEASVPGDGLTAVQYLVCNVFPARFTYAMHIPEPELDNRFISLALQSHAELRKAAGPGDPADIMFICGIAGAETVLNNCKPSGMIVFWGCAPGGNMQRIPSPASLRYSIARPDEAGPFEHLDIDGLPSPFSITKPVSSELTDRSALLKAVVSGCTAGCDTLQLIYRGKYMNHSTVVFAMQGMWRWDFWPLMNETNAEKPFNFSETAIEFIKETALANHSDAFFAFPSSQRTETDSIRFQALFPATIPSSVPLVVRFTVSGQGKTAIDTSIQVFAGPLARPLITCPPLPAGRYAYTASITKGARFTCVDSLTVEKDRSEQLIGGQNVLMMSAFMQPLAIDDSSAIRAFLTNRKTAVNENTLISEVFQIRRTWVLLIFLFLLFGAEWLLRRRMHLD